MGASAGPGRPDRRARQAEQTRREIVQAARGLFAGKGYRATTVKDVAAAAGVSVQTVYDSVGSKHALVVELNNLIDAEAGIAAIVAGAMAEEDPVALAAVPARITRALLEHCGDIIRAGLAGVDEPELAAIVAEGHRRHVDGAARIVQGLQALGALAPAIDTGTTAETIAVLCDSAFGVLLIDDYGWSLDRVESFMVDAVQRVALRSAAAS